MSKSVVIDEDDCISCGTCEEICPDVFHMNDESGIAEVILAEGGPAEQIQEATEACPVECIHWEN
ncbi:MAG: ferredoxin [Desulfobacterales bacterium]